MSRRASKVAPSTLKSKSNGDHSHAPEVSHGHGTVSKIIVADNATITGTTGKDNFFAGISDTLTGGGGHDEFHFKSNAGVSVITDFITTGDNSDILDLKKAGLTVTSFADLMTHVTEVGSDAVVDLGGGNTVTLKGVDMTTLTAANFEFAAPRSGGGHRGDDHGNHSLAGYVTTIGTSADDTLTASSVNTVLVGGGGNDTLIAGAGNDILVGGIGNDKLIGSTGNDKLISHGGNDIMTGGGGTNMFSVGAEHGAVGNTEITDFVAGKDIVFLEHTGLHVTSFADLMTHVAQSGANAVLDYGNGHALTLDNVQTTALSAHDFIL